ncbi:MAG: hypothetical protein QOH90_988 [Actinomycetota bacterium]|nr:hypothetical protein [Actinomycetota bacterium]
MIRGRRVVAAATFLVTLLAGGSPAAVAHDHRVPKAVLFTGSDRQVGREAGSTWIWWDGHYCVNQISDAAGIFQKDSALLKPEAKIRIRLAKAQRPEQLEIRAWRRVHDGRAVGAGSPVDYVLKTHLHRGRKVWVASFTPDVRSDYFLKVDGFWPDHSRCGGMQSASWQFHVRAPQ